jgi:hypothetical protein
MSLFVLSYAKLQFYLHSGPSVTAASNASMCFSTTIEVTNLGFYPGNIVPVSTDPKITVCFVFNVTAVRFFVLKKMYLHTSQ